MPHTKHLAAVHNQLTHFLTPDAVHAVDTLIKELIRTSSILPKPQPKPVIIKAMPATYFRMNRRLELIEIGAPLLDALDLETPDPILGHAWETFLPPDERVKLRNEWLGAVQMHEGFTHSYPFTTPAGRIVLLQQKAIPEFNQSMDFIGWFVFVKVVVPKVIKMDTPHGPSERQRA